MSMLTALIHSFQLAFVLVMTAVLPSHALAETIAHRFGPGSIGDPAWERRFNAQLDYYRLTPNGWVIDFKPSGSENERSGEASMRPGGFRSAFFVEGDFAAIVEFQVKRIAAPTQGSGAGPVLKVEFDQGESTVSIACVRRRDNAWALRGYFSDDLGERQPFEFTIPRAATRLAIAREGRVLKFRRDLGKGKLDEFYTYHPNSSPRRRGRISLIATTGGSNTALQMVVQNISVHTQKASIGARAKPPAQRGWMMAACSFAVLAVGGLLYRAWGHRAA